MISQSGKPVQLKGVDLQRIYPDGFRREYPIPQETLLADHAGR